MIKGDVAVSLVRTMKKYGGDHASSEVKIDILCYRSFVTTKREQILIHALMRMSIFAGSLELKERGS